jgi:glycerol-3-phosphate dehydrogenase
LRFHKNIGTIKPKLILGRELEKTLLRIFLTLEGGTIMIDIIVIGAGIIGSTVFYELTKQVKSVHLFEKNKEAGLEVSGHNSAIVHSGIDPHSNTLKAKYNLMGQAMYEDYARELETPFKRVGAFVVAKDIEECKHLDLLEERAKQRHVHVVRYSNQEALSLEPNLNPNIVSVLEMPTTAIVDPTHLSSQAVKKGVINGGEAHFEEMILSIEPKLQYFEVETNKGTYQARVIVNCAGLYADKMEALVGDATFTLRYRKGEYIVLSPQVPPVSSRIIYPVPSPLGKGVLYVPTISGRALVGPNAVDVDDFNPHPILDVSVDDMKLKMNQLISNVPYELEIDRFVGFRPRVDNDDFVIHEHPNVPYFFTLAGIESPGIASAPAIAKDITNTMILPGLTSRLQGH